MSRIDRAVRRTRQHLDRDEGLLASAWGREVDGRRHRVVLVTDRRVVVGWRRPAPPDELSMTTSATYHASEGRLELADGDHVVELRDVEPDEGRRVARLTDRRYAQPLSERIGSGNHVRIVGG